jgi:pimeloyl-ACP methyl ester carboxylesterase
VTLELQTHELEVGELRARCHVAGEGPALVLVHGGWGGSAMHWSSVWRPLVRRGFRVILPELPGVGAMDQPGLKTLTAYAKWLDALLSSFEVERAHLVGNSLGAAVAWAFALEFAPRCASLVMVNGMPYRHLPAPVRFIAGSWPTRWVIREVLRRAAYRPQCVPRAFFDPSLAPESLQQLLREGAPKQIDDVVSLFLSGLPFALPRSSVLWVWGERDRLPGRSLQAARTWQSRLPGSVLRSIPEAGHLPQLERPELFVEAVARFIYGQTTAQRVTSSAA